jgi:hypothetical protein
LEGDQVPALRVRQALETVIGICFVGSRGCGGRSRLRDEESGLLWLPVRPGQT